MALLVLVECVIDGMVVVGVCGVDGVCALCVLLVWAEEPGEEQPGEWASSHSLDKFCTG